jgi:murein L,D-transpeptidase YafK
MRTPFLLLAAVLTSGLGAGGPPARAQIVHSVEAKADLVIVHKAKRTLELRRDGEVLASYRVALGPEPTGTKRQEGDGRTPEGVYTLDWRNTESGFYRSLHISYPSPADRTPADRWGVSAGGLIMIHGMPKGRNADSVGHPSNDWTNGCIAVTNDEIDHIWQSVEDGTTIIIYP